MELRRVDEMDNNSTKEYRNIQNCTYAERFYGTISGYRVLPQHIECLYSTNTNSTCMWIVD